MRIEITFADVPAVRADVGRYEDLIAATAEEIEVGVEVEQRPRQIERRDIDPALAAALTTIGIEVTVHGARPVVGRLIEALKAKLGRGELDWRETDAYR